MADHAGTVATMYEAFGRGDVGTILDHLADDVEWEVGVRDTGLDYLRERHGKQEVAEFFSALTANLTLTHFEPMVLCAADDHVAVPVRHAGNINGGGEIAMTNAVHLWRFGADGKVVSFKHLFDYAIHERAAAARSAAFTGRTLRVLDDVIHVDAAGGQVEIFDFSGPAESGPPPHSHPWDEAYIGVDGAVEVTMDDTTRTVRAGDVVHVPGGTLHSYRIVSDTARFRVITSGHRASAFFADLDSNAPSGPLSPETLPGTIEIARRHGLASPLFA